MVREQALTAGLSPMGIRTPQHEGCSARSIRKQSPLTVEISWEEIAAAVSVPKDQSMDSRSIRGLRHPAMFWFAERAPRDRRLSYRFATGATPYSNSDW